MHGSGFYFGKNSGIAKIFYGWDWFAAAHELGHALGLHHDFRDNTYIMSYGRMDRLSAQLSECTAEYLAANPHFNPDIPTEEAPPPTIELVSSPNYPVGSNSVPVQLRVRDAEGLYQVLLNSSGQRGTELITCRGLTGETDTVVEFDYDGVIPSFSRTSLSDPALHSIYVAAVDIAGNMSEASFNLAATSPQHIATLEGHTQSVYSVAFSPNGTILASASRDSTVKLWNVSTRAHSATLRHGENVTSVSFSPMGQHSLPGQGMSSYGTFRQKKMSPPSLGIWLSVRCRFHPMAQPLLPGEESLSAVMGSYDMTPGSDYGTLQRGQISPPWKGIGGRSLRCRFHPMAQPLLRSIVATCSNCGMLQRGQISPPLRMRVAVRWRFHPME